MRDGYVSVLFNFLTRTASPATSAPQPMQEWLVVHDATGKIVVRDAKHDVVATARWLDHKAVDRVHGIFGVPDEKMWLAIQHAILGALREARGLPPDPRTDEGVVERPAIEPRSEKLAEGADTKPVGIVGWIGMSLVVGVLGFVLFVVVFWVVPWLKRHDLMPQGTTANGSVCRTDSDCKSGDCYKKTCRGEAVKVRGDRCDRDNDCKSGSCQFSSNTCN